METREQLTNRLNQFQQPYSTSLIDLPLEAQLYIYEFQLQGLLEENDASLERAAPMLELACKEKNALLRDVAICAGANAVILLKNDLKKLLINKLIVENKDRLNYLTIEKHNNLNNNLKNNEFVLSDENPSYSNIKFLLNTRAKIELSDEIQETDNVLKTNYILKQAILLGKEGAKVLALIFDHLDQRSALDEGQLARLLKTMDNSAYNLLETRSIDLLYNKPYLKSQIREAYLSILPLSEAQFYAAIGDEKGLQDLLNANTHSKTMDLSSVFYEACFKGRTNIIKLLIARGADINAKKGIMLAAAISGEREEAVALLLSYDHIDLSQRPDANSLNLYELGIRSSSEKIKQLFIQKKERKENEIETVGQVPWFSWWSPRSAAQIQGASTSQQQDGNNNGHNNNNTNSNTPRPLGSPN